MLRKHQAAAFCKKATYKSIDAPEGGKYHLPATSPATQRAPGTLVAFFTECQSLLTSLELHLLERIESQELLKDIHYLRIPEEEKYH